MVFLILGLDNLVKNIKIKNRWIESMRRNEALKFIGLSMMIIDHFNLFVFSADPVIYTVARFLGFPLFAYGVSVGALNTSNFKNYVLRLLLVGILVQPLFYLATDSKILNVVFTLLLGAVAVRLWHSKNLYFQFLSLSICLIGGTWSFPLMDYGSYGIALILAFSLGPVIATVYIILTSILFYIGSHIQFMAIFTIPVIYYLPLPKISLPRWVYYFMYPGHLFIITAINVVNKI